MTEKVSRKSSGMKSSKEEERVVRKSSSGDKENKKSYCHIRTKKIDIDSSKKDIEIRSSQDDIKVYRTGSYDKSAESFIVPRALSPQPEKRSRFHFFHKKQDDHHHHSDDHTSKVREKEKEKEKPELARKHSFFSSFFRKEPKERMYFMFLPTNSSFRASSTSR